LQAYVVAARVDVEEGGESNGAAKPQDHVDGINEDHQQRVEAEAFLDCRRNEVEEGEEGERRQEDHVVDD